MKIGLFDAGVGSFMFAHKLRMLHPASNIVYLADRKNFPYGAKDSKTLVPIISDTIDYLKHKQQCDLVIMASNAPTIMCFDMLPDTKNVIGVYPPFEKASDLSVNRKIGVMGVRSLVQSEQFDTLKKAKEKELSIEIKEIDSSSIIDKVIENGVFCSKPEIAKNDIKTFMDSVKNSNPDIDVFTLSSTHLPWINYGDYCYLNQLYPDTHFIDPSDDIINGLNLKNDTNNNKGNLLCLATESQDYTAYDLEMILSMGHNVTINPVIIRN